MSKSAAVPSLMLLLATACTTPRAIPVASPAAVAPVPPDKVCPCGGHEATAEHATGCPCGERSEKETPSTCQCGPGDGAS